jgi:hypothetical protein
MLGIFIALELPGCVVEERVVDRPPDCRGGVWISGYRSRRGYRHPGYWRCPGHRRVVVVE